MSVGTSSPQKRIPGCPANCARLAVAPSAIPTRGVIAAQAPSPNASATTNAERTKAGRRKLTCQAPFADWNIHNHYYATFIKALAVARGDCKRPANIRMFTLEKQAIAQPKPILPNCSIKGPKAPVSHHPTSWQRQCKRSTRSQSDQKTMARSRSFAPKTDHRD